jgi:hypothetical protein
MEQDSIRQYSDAVTELEKARGQVRQLQEIIGKLYSYLDNPYELMISNVNVPGAYPAEVGFRENAHFFDAVNWPQIQQIAEALIRLRGKRKVVEEIWDKLSDIDRVSVMPLPERQ